jgi:hypothetical protein
MPTEGCTEELSVAQKRIIYGFDEAAKGLAAGTISRSRAVKLAGAALLAPVLVPFLAAPAEAANPCAGRLTVNNRDCPPLTETRCRPRREGQVCSCFKTVHGDTRCVDVTGGLFCPTTDECDRNRDCPDDELCVKIGGCCEGSRHNVCAKKC